MASRLAKGGAVAAAAVALITAWEGLRTVAYKDSVGIATVCVGETRGVKMGDRYTVDECKDKLTSALKDFETGMRACLKAPDAIPDKVYVSMLSVSYNIGTGAFCRSSMARNLNAGNYTAACNSLLLYTRAGGKVIQGLVNRRDAERKLCLAGV